MKKYKTAYVTQASGYDFKILLEICEEIKFVTTGYELDKDLALVISNTLRDFSPKKDLLVPVGNVASNLIIGLEAAFICQQQNVRELSVAFYRDKDYVVHKIPALERINL